MYTSVCALLPDATSKILSSCNKNGRTNFEPDINDILKKPLSTKRLDTASSIVAFSLLAYFLYKVSNSCIANFNSGAVIIRSMASSTARDLITSFPTSFTGAVAIIFSGTTTVLFIFTGLTPSSDTKTLSASVSLKIFSIAFADLYSSVPGVNPSVRVSVLVTVSFVLVIFAFSSFFFASSFCLS